jgi:hypothetical protein
MRRLLVISVVFAILVLTNGCAGTCQRIKANGSLVGSTNGDWIVVKQSGGEITDVYKLENVMVQSEQGSDGWLFLDQNSNPVHIGGDMKAIRVTTRKAEIFDSYIEYHMEHETMSYQEKWALKGK